MKLATETLLDDYGREYKQIYWDIGGTKLNLEKLFEMQKVLDDRIVKEKGLEGRDLFKVMNHALRIEIAEAENEWQGFKVWKENPQPKPKLLEELVDILHFIISQGIRKKVDYKMYAIIPLREDEILDQFEYLFDNAKEFGIQPTTWRWARLFSVYINLAEMLGFTWEQIEQAYMDKNKVNHERQENGY